VLARTGAAVGEFVGAGDARYRSPRRDTSAAASMPDTKPEWLNVGPMNPGDGVAHKRNARALCEVAVTGCTHAGEVRLSINMDRAPISLRRRAFASLAIADLDTSGGVTRMCSTALARSPRSYQGLRSLAGVTVAPGSRNMPEVGPFGPDLPDGWLDRPRRQHVAVAQGHRHVVLRRAEVIRLSAAARTTPSVAPPTRAPGRQTVARVHFRLSSRFG